MVVYLNPVSMDLVFDFGLISLCFGLCFGLCLGLCFGGLSRTFPVLFGELMVLLPNEWIMRKEHYVNSYCVLQHKLVIFLRLCSTLSQCCLEYSFFGANRGIKKPRMPAKTLA